MTIYAAMIMPQVVLSIIVATLHPPTVKTLATVHEGYYTDCTWNMKWN